MAENFAKTITSAGAGWENLLTNMLANGYAGGALLECLTIEESAGNTIQVKIGHSTNASAPGSTSDGKAFSVKAETFWHVEAARCWIYTSGAHAYDVTATSEIS